MAEETKIQWATSTGNPWIGCTKVSPGCKNCYAATLDEQRFSMTMGGSKEKPVSHWGKGAPRVRTKGFWKDALRWNKEAGDFMWKCPSCGATFVDCESLGTPYKCPECPETLVPNRPRIFPSLCDWLDEEVPIEWLADFLKLIHDTPNLDWLLLTKRPENFSGRMLAVSQTGDSRRTVKNFAHCIADDWRQNRVIPNNVWTGASAEDQKRADERIPELLKIPAKVRFLSVEPLLSPVSLQNFLLPTAEDVQAIYAGRFPEHPRIHWVIVGGESGPGARVCNVKWIKDVVNQCRAASVPVFVKQVGSEPGFSGDGVFHQHDAKSGLNIMRLKDRKGGDPSEWPEDLRVREFPQ